MRTSTAERPHPVTRAPLASVRPGRNDWHVAHVPLVELSDLHRDEGCVSEGRQPEPTLSAYTTCDAIVSGELPHAAAGHAHPHAVRVCILREDNDRAIFDRLLLEAGQPRARLSEVTSHA